MATATTVKELPSLAEESTLVHPALRPRKPRRKVDAKQRRTTVRTMKLINPTNPEKPVLTQVPIEPGHNNAGNLNDPLNPIRFYLNKGFIEPHIWDRKKYPGIYCAVRDCWDWATVTDDPEFGTERCEDHQVMWEQGLVRYAVSAKEYRD